MDQELPQIAEHLKTRMPFLRSERNDLRMAHEFLTRLIADGKKCFQKRSGSQYVAHSEAIEAVIEKRTNCLCLGEIVHHTPSTLSVQKQSS